MWELRFWKDATERAVKTAAQAFLVAGGGNLMDFWAADWKAMAGAAAGGLVFSIVSSLASRNLPWSDRDTASAVKLDE